MYHTTKGFQHTETEYISMWEELLKKEGLFAKSLFDNGSRDSVAKVVSGMLLNDTIILSHVEDQLFCLVSNAPFGSEAECVEVARTLKSTFFVPDILPYTCDHHGRELADRCLVSLAWFPRAIETRHVRKGAPKPSYYRMAGKQAFIQEGQIAIADHFERWEAFLSEMI